MQSESSHFKGKEPLEHVAEVQARGILTSAEIHGTPLPGHLYALADSAKEMAFFLLLIAIFFEALGVGSALLLALFAISLTIWKGGRSSLLAWARLERMHRVVEQERWEIQHHRKQEKLELKELYRAKGFEGKLLDDVIDVLMADDERLLNVMVQEELSLEVESEEHPLKQGLGAVIGSLLAASIIIAAYMFQPALVWPLALIVIAIASGCSAYYVGNKKIPAVIWNLSLALFSLLTLYFLQVYLR